MKIEADGDEKISVTLTADDMQELDITYEEMDYANIETRRVIWTILDEAKRILGRSINIDNRLLVQVSPEKHGGCIISFIESHEEVNSHKKRIVMKKETDQFLFEAFDENSFLECISILNDEDMYTEKPVFIRLDNTYFGAIKPQINYIDKMLYRLSEYGNISQAKNPSIAKLIESGELLSP